MVVQHDGHGVALSRLSTRIKDAGIAIRHSRGRILFYTAGSRNGLKGVDVGGTHSKKRKLSLRKRHFFVTSIEQYIEDVKQKEKDVPDLLEAIMKAPGLVKEEIRQILMKMSQFRPEIPKIRVCTFQMSGKITDSSKTSPRAPLFAIFGRASGQIFKKCTFLAPAGANYSSL